MKSYAVNINEIKKDSPSEKEIRQKLRRYRLKEKLGSFELFDGADSVHERNLIKAGFKRYVEYRV